MAEKSKGFEWAYRDLLTALMVVFMALGLLSIIASQRLKTIEGVQPGQLLVQMTWKNGSTSDIDLWVKSPDDEPVGYTRAAGKTCDLLRDDLGRAMDLTSHAIELTVCRDPPPGEYLINVHLYNIHLAKAYGGVPEQTWDEVMKKELPMPVTVLITKADKKNPGHMKKILEKEVMLDHAGQELTVARFELDGDANLVAGSLNDLPLMMRTKGM